MMDLKKNTFYRPLKYLQNVYTKLCQLIAEMPINREIFQRQIWSNNVLISLVIVFL